MVIAVTTINIYIINITKLFLTCLYQIMKYVKGLVSEIAKHQVWRMKEMFLFNYAIV